VRKQDDILQLLMEKEAESVQRGLSGLVLQPGAIGDCLLTLPLIRFMKEQLGLGSVAVLGHTDYVGMFPVRTCADGIRSIDTVDLHRLFVKPKDFDLADADPLISTFAGYSWIVSFLGEPESNFEQNLIYTANCSTSAEVITLTLKPPKGHCGHIADYYIEQFVEQCALTLARRSASKYTNLVRPTSADKRTGRDLLDQAGERSDQRTIVIHPGSGGRSKCCHLDNLLAAAEELGNNASIVFLLGPAELERYDGATIARLRKAGKCLSGLSLAQVVAVLSCADIFIGNDSGITHLAAQMGVRTVALFGPTDPTVYGPVGPMVEILQGPKTTFSRKPSIKLQVQLVEVANRE
jgi:hypothetical protein